MRTNIIDQSGTYLQRVYGWLTFGMALCALTAFISVTAGTPVDVNMGEGIVYHVPPAVALVASHPIIFGLIFIGFALCAAIFRKSQSAGIPLFVGFTALSGLFIGPSIYFAQVVAASGGTLSANPVRDAGLLTILAFGSLTGYAMVTKRDFSGWGAFLTTGLWVIIGAGLLNLFLGSSAFGLAISSVSVLLFVGFILYDTQAVIQQRNGDDALGDALNLFLDVLNLFLNLLRILSHKD